MSVGPFLTAAFLFQVLAFVVDFFVVKPYEAARCDVQDACTELAVTHKRTRLYRPQTNGKIELFHPTLADGWAYARFYDPETERRAALPDRLHFDFHCVAAPGPTPFQSR
jgi:hypothetical protein